MAAEGDIGVRGPSHTGATSPAAPKPESKLWWNDGVWWASMFDAPTASYRIFRLDQPTQTWVNTNVPLDPRRTSSADTLWDGNRLYVASHVVSTNPISGYPSRLYRYSYNATTKTYSLDSGFPVSINNFRTETLVIAKDSTGKLWATWVQNNTVYVNRTMGNDSTWGTPFALPVSGASVDKDDISSIVAFGGNKIGVMWSNQANNSLNFAIHRDGIGDTTWEQSVNVLPAPNKPDDHISLKSDGSGRVFAVIKTENTSALDPGVMLLARNATSGTWSSSVVWQVTNEITRPILVVDEGAGLLRAFGTSPCCVGGTIYEKTSPIASPAFGQGLGTAFIRDAESLKLLNTTSIKRPVDAGTGLVVLADNDTTDFYWHNFSSSQPPVADFSGSPRSGTAPLQVGFTDLSSGGATGWSWDFGDGTSSTAQNPTHTYTSAGTYSVALTASNAGGSDSETKTGYITVAAPPAPVADFSGSPRSGTAPLQVGFTDLSSGGATGWSWDFGDGTSSTAQNPTHTYTSAGTYSVALTASNAGGSDSETKTGYITVAAPPAPVADFSGSPRSGTAPLQVGFTDLSSGGATGWSWDFGDGTSSTAQNPTHTYTSAGTYSVALTASNAGGSDSETKTGYITVTPSAAPMFRSASSAANITETTLSIPLPAGVAAGDLLLASVDVRGAPTITAPSGWTLIRLDANGTAFRKATYYRVAGAAEPASYTWAFSSSQAAAGGILAYSGANTSEPIDGSSGLPSTATNVITAPSLTTTLPNTLLVGLFGAAGGITITPPTGMSERYDVASIQGTFKVTSEAADTTQNTAGATGDKTARADTGTTPNIGQLIAIRPAGVLPPAPVADFSGSPRSGTAPLQVGFTDLSSGGATGWSWDFGDGTSSTAQNPTHTYTSAGTYSVALTASNAGGSDSETKTGYITVAAPPAPVADFSGSPRSGTAPLQVGFTDLSSGGATGWSWDFGDGTSSTAQNPTHTYTSAGTYSVALTASNAGGSDSETKTGYITVAAPPAPVADFSGSPRSGTAPLQVGFTDLSSGGATGWSWDFGDGTSSTAQNPTHTYTSAGTYSVALTASNAGGSDSETKTGYITVTPSAAPMFRSASSAANITETTLSIPLPAGVAAGDLLLASVDVRGAPTITAPSGWTLIRLDANGTAFRKATYYRVAGAAEPASYTWAFSSSQAAAGGILAYSGANTSEPIDGSSGLPSTATNVITAPSLTTTLPNTLLVGLFGAAGGITITPPTGMSERYDVASIQGTFKVTSEAADTTQNTAGATGDKTARADTGTTPNIGQLIAIRPAAS